MPRAPEGPSLRLHPSGVYYARFRLGDRRYEISTSSRKKREAGRRASQLYADAVAGELHTQRTEIQKDISLEEINKLFILAKRGCYAEGTLDIWEMYLATHFVPYFETLTGLAAKHRVRGYAEHRLKKVKAKTVSKELSVLRGLLNWCVDQGFLSQAPEVPKLPRLATGTPHTQRRRGRATELNEDEVEALLAALPEYSTRRRGQFVVRARFVVMRETALRPKALSALTVPGNYQLGSDLLFLRDEDDKARYGRELPLTPRARDALDSVCPENGFIFGRHDYRTLLSQAAEQVLPPHKAERFTAYDLRHFRLTELACTGNLPGAAYLAGHRRITTINAYAKPNLREAVKALAAAGGGRG